MNERGFTLIELMITVAIVAILAAVAEASYVQYVHRGYRSEAKAILMQDAAILERNFTVANRYDKDSGGNSMSNQIVQKSPTSGSVVYDISVAFLNGGMNYTLTAAPHAGGPMATDDCGSLTLADSGKPDITNLPAGSTATAPVCWSK